MEGVLYDNNLLSFIILTGIIAGAMAFATGSAMAAGWKSYVHLVGYTLLLTCAERFLQFALFEGPLLSLQYFVVDALVLLVFAFAGFHLRRAEQMRRQYGFRTPPS